MPFSKLVFTPTSYVGKGALDSLIVEVNKYSPKKIAVVTDPILLELGLVEEVISPILQLGIELKVFSEVMPEPSLELGEKVVAFVREEKCDMVIGIGGGSALDLAKLAAVLSAHPESVATYLNLTGTQEISEKGLPKLLLPTTAGTGSEVTNIAVLSLGNTKDVVAHDFLLADAAIVDPLLTISVPPRVTAATGIDALTHAIEAYLSKNASSITDALALHAVKLIGKSLRNAVENGNDIMARTNMCEASYMAGLSFFNAGVAGVHALAYPLGGQYHLPHGEANAVLLPYVMEYIKSSSIEKMAELSVALDPNSKNLEVNEAADHFIKLLFQFIKDVKLPAHLAEYDIPEDAIEALSDDAVKQTRLLARSPMTLDKQDIYKIYQKAYIGNLVG